MKRLSLDGTLLSDDQWIKLFTRMSEMTIDLDSTDLTAIPSKVVADVLSNVKILGLLGTRLINDQWVNLFTRMSEMTQSRRSHWQSFGKM